MWICFSFLSSSYGFFLDSLVYQVFQFSYLVWYFSYPLPAVYFLFLLSYGVILQRQPSFPIFISTWLSGIRLFYFILFSYVRIFSSYILDLKIVNSFVLSVFSVIKDVLLPFLINPFLFFPFLPLLFIIYFLIIVVLFLFFIFMLFIFYPLSSRILRNSYLSYFLWYLFLFLLSYSFLSSVSYDADLFLMIYFLPFQFCYFL